MDVETTSSLGAKGGGAGVLRPVRGRLLAAVLCQAGGALCAVVPLLSLVGIVEGLLRDDDSDVAGWAATAVVGALARALLMWVAITLSHRADNDLQLETREQIVAALARRPLSHFDTRSSAEIKRTVSDDVGALHHLVGHSILDLTSALVTPVAALGVLLVTAPRMAPIALLPVLVGVLLTRGTTRRISATMGGYESVAAELDAAVVDHVRGLRIVRFFDIGAGPRARFAEAVDRYAVVVHDWATSLSARIAATQVVLAPLTTIVLVVTVGAAFVASGWTGLAGVLTAALLAPVMAAPMLAMSFTLQDIAQGRAALDRIAASLAAPPVPHRVAPGSLADPDAPVAVELERVGLRHTDAAPAALDEVDLSLAPGRTVAVVGPSGAGKSSLAEVVAGLRPPTSGRIRLDGVDYLDLPESAVLERVSYVAQDPLFLRASVRDNLTIGLPPTSEAELDRALRAAVVDDVVARLPQGPDTVLGTGLDLSGGERQRLSLARGLVAARPLLVLDEATSALDPTTESTVLDRLREHTDGVAVLVIAHRLASIRHADEIVVLDRGRVVQRGRHEALVGSGGLYAQMWAAQQRDPVPA